MTKVSSLALGGCSCPSPESVGVKCFVPVPSVCHYKFYNILHFINESSSIFMLHRMDRVEPKHPGAWGPGQRADMQAQEEPATIDWAATHDPRIPFRLPRRHLAAEAQA
jgi:hypothetical protein